MNFEKSTQKSQEAILSALRLAENFSHQIIEPGHLLLALINQKEGIVPGIITQVSGSITGIQDELSKQLDNLPKIQGANTQTGLSSQSGDVLNAAESFAKGMKDDYVSTEHILLGLTESPEANRLNSYGLTRDAILKALTEVRGSQRVTTQTPEDTYDALGKYGRELTDMARRGKLDPVIGRDEEIRWWIQILSRRMKNNPALIGNPGAG